MATQMDWRDLAVRRQPFLYASLYGDASCIVHGQGEHVGYIYVHINIHDLLTDVSRGITIVTEILISL